MDSASLDKIKKAANSEVIRRLLLRYIATKGYRLDQPLIPTDIIDLPYAIPQLVHKVEIIPTVKEINNIAGNAILSWNLFVLGSHRMFLGETYHNDLKQLATDIKSGRITADLSQLRRFTTPKKLVAFIYRVLTNHEDGFIDVRDKSLPSYPLPGASMVGPVFFNRTGRYS